MPQLRIDRNSHIALIEDAWWIGYLDGKTVDVHAKIYRSDGGDRRGQFGVNAHLHSRGGGAVIISSGAPKHDKLFWAQSRDEAIEGALAQLEAKEDSEVD